jgi:hypothetical protein
MHITIVQAGGGELDEDLTRPRNRSRHLFVLQHLWAAKLMNANGFHVILLA